MERVKVTRNYQVTIPASIRRRAGIEEGSMVSIFYDEDENAIKIIPIKHKRLTIRIGRRISVEEMEKAVEGMLDESTT
ncbi:MAG: AbrB/MazE/SpoVT family DNA-binding domain-containing protein [Candidatus Nitrosocaldus sp.]|nr:AbrB/MazE/SpoVT family DNA-binding domain-containing protein [Candidatus Nitrosocaldus sp.]MCS7141585.1 AbrB/MazE/SpoVT family DNA-binding domain-containing protein [Candidatus Nitrosocaldus sp.]MDW8000506.1 AbrB/MazE/SpoVT family DNA-binding domain-containing protein [Candidatus Nitrosocaldus sp.]MDW8275446.1 AbrB/MazE/SpoVT family DNA-binding domain-containing protein [Candidatus Nitrosocaldus sp.]